MNDSNKRYSRVCLLGVLSLVGCLFAAPCRALEPAEILVLANRNAARSVGLAKYYMQKRKIPAENLIQLWVTDKETCSRFDYEKKVAAPVRRHLQQKAEKWRIRCLVIMYGLPLKVVAPDQTAAEKKMLADLKQKQKTLTDQLQSIKNLAAKNQTQLKSELESINKKISNFKKSTDKGASLDSEMALVLKKDYPLSGWLQNPYFAGFKDIKLPINKENILMVSRLDGPSDKIVKRIIDDSIQTEKKGLKGTAYFDARWPDPGNKKLTGYAFYDQSIYRTADRVKKSGLIPVQIETTEELFPPGACPNAALYCGWYSLARYIDAFVWQPGAIGYHIASSECTTLKRNNSRVWCKMMLEKGVAATIGPVGEPYVQAFAVPEIFFGFLIDGYLSLAECYLISTPFLSWKMVLIGDPLYRPFKQNRDP